MKIEKEEMEKFLIKFYQEKIQKLDFFSNKPVNFMVTHFLINKMLYKLYNNGPLTPKDLIECVYAEDFDHKKTEWLINGTYFPFGKFFNLLKIDNQERITLTRLGKVYVESDNSRPKDISELLSSVIRDWIVYNPFKSKVVNEIYYIVESALELMRNNEIISDLDFGNYFALKSGKFYEWKKLETKKTHFNNYRNLCEGLRLIKTFNKNLLLTQEGYKFIIQLQLNRVREMFNLL